MSDDMDEERRSSYASAGILAEKVMTAVSQAFAEYSLLEQLPYDIQEIIEKEMKLRDAAVLRSIAGPPMIHVYPKPAPPPPSRELLKKYIAHVSAVSGTKFLISFMQSNVSFTEAEMSELYELEAAYHTGRRA